ncbi:MAG: hypothetical protein IIW58_02550 [Bacteroidales bacterium]|jgi:hypothetical protein|nr:hypothetical protein [Bacteroidales bacterium]
MEEIKEILKENQRLAKENQEIFQRINKKSKIYERVELVFSILFFAVLTIGFILVEFND